MYDILIIGGGPGGIYAGIISSLKSLNSCLIEQSKHLGGQPINLYPEKDIYDMPGFVKIKGEELITKMVEQLESLEEFKPKILLETKIIKINKRNDIFQVETNNGVLETKTIVIATGIGKYEPIKIDENEVQILDNKNIFYKFNKNDFRNKKIVILGGGDSALDWANHMIENNISSDVSIIHRRNELRAREEKIIKAKKNNIKLVLNSNIKKIDKNSILVENNESHENKNISFDALFVQYGNKFAGNDIKEIFKEFNIEMKTKIIIDMNCQTSERNVFAIGQAVEFDSSPNMILNACADASRAIYKIRNILKK